MYIYNNFVCVNMYVIYRSFIEKYNQFPLPVKLKVVFLAPKKDAINKNLPNIQSYIIKEKKNFLSSPTLISLEFNPNIARKIHSP